MIKKMTNKTGKRITTNYVLAYIRGNGGFDNFNRWKRKEVSEWVKNYFGCSRYVANRVSYIIV